MKWNYFVILLIVGGLCVCTGAVNAEIIAQFEDAGTPGVDTVPGMLGDGWRSGWAVDATGTGSATPSLATSDPVSSGNYLAYDQTDNNADGYSASLNRRYYTSSLNDDYFISFDLRFDNLSMWTVMDESLGKTTTDYFWICGTTDDNYNHDGAETGWALRVQGIKADNSFDNGMHVRFTSSTVADEWSDFAVQEGNTYGITIAVHNGDHTYEATVNEVGTSNSYTTSVPHGMESAVDTDYLMFLTEMREQGGSTFGYSVDNVRIANTAPVPEPSSLVLLVLGLGSLLIARRKSLR